MNNNKLGGSNLIFPELDLKNVSLSGNGLKTLCYNAFTNLKNVTIINLLNNNLTSVDLLIDGFATPAYNFTGLSTSIGEKQLKVDRNTKLTIKKYGACPKNCTCNCYEVTCVNTDLDNVISTVVDLKVAKFSIRDTPIRHIKKLPMLNVVVIELSHCELETIEENAFDNIPMLTNLTLDYNFLTEIPKLGKMKSLLKFSARKNKISKVSKQLLSHRVTHIDLSHNLLDNVDFLKPTNATLQRLDLSHNFIRRFVISNFSELTYVNLNGNLLGTEESVVLNNISKLEVLGLAENSIRHLNVLRISDTPIKKLRLNQNLLYSQLDFTNYTSLTVLDLDDNMLTTLPIMPANLEVLWLNDNQLKSSNVIFPPLKLEFIYLAGNHMDPLPFSAVVNLKNLKYVNLAENNFHDVNGLLLPPHQTSEPYGYASQMPYSVGWPYLESEIDGYYSQYSTPFG
uniref:LRRNT domain-containing protein n=1 Tax=Panagrellus redivivus TaxID=6233 RepID=A0A7E4W688_PANRE